MDILVSIVIPVFNRKELLLSLLQDIRKQSYNSLEVVVIDDCSNENIAEEVKQNFPNVKVVRCKRRFGPAFAKNLGVLKAKGKYILFIDSDTEIVNKDMVKEMVQIAENNRMIGQVGGELCKFDGVYNGQGGNTNFDGYSRNRTILLCRVDQQRIFECDFIFTSNCLVERRKVFEVGGFDHYFIYPGEDKDLGYRLKKKGYINCLSASTLLKHTVSEIAGCKTRFYDCYRTKLRFAIKHRGIYMLLVAPIWDGMREIILMLIAFKKRLSFFIRPGSPNYKKFIIAYSRSKRKSGNFIISYITAFWWNVKMIINTIKSRKTDYLSARTIHRFIQFAEKTKLLEKEIFY